jgi:hypothetical protein
MPKRSNNFQRLMVLLHHCFAGTARVTESALVRDQITDDEREVDVYIEAKTADYPMNIAVEVVGTRRKADITWVERMHAKHASLPTNKLVIVSERGFSKPALRRAALYGIEALSIEEALSSDWQFAAKLTATGFIELITFKYGCAIVYESTKDGSLKQEEIGPLSTITDESKEAAVTIDQLLRYALDQPEIKAPLYEQLRKSSDRQFWLRYTPHADLTTLVDGAVVRVKELRIGISVDHTETPVQFSTGRFRGTPFLSGSSHEPGTKQLQFVLIKNREGRVEGRILDEAGIRSLLSDTFEPQEETHL